MLKVLTPQDGVLLLVLVLILGCPALYGILRIQRILRSQPSDLVCGDARQKRQLRIYRIGCGALPSFLAQRNGPKVPTFITWISLLPQTILVLMITSVLSRI